MKHHTMSDHYILEDRLHIYMYHWIVYMLGGLRRIHPKTSDSRTKIYFHPFHDHGYHRQSLKLLEDVFEFCEPAQDANIIKHHGEPLILADQVDPGTYDYLRQLFLSRVPEMKPNGGKYYITRKNSETVSPGNAGRKIRHVLNEEEFIPILKDLGFKIIHFEDYTFEEKIRIFQTASVIVSPNSACLTFSLFAAETTQIIEITPTNLRHQDHYKNICERLNIPYSKFTNLTTVGEVPAIGAVWNMIVNSGALIDFVKPFL